MILLSEVAGILTTLNTETCVLPADKIGREVSDEKCAPQECADRRSIFSINKRLLVKLSVAMYVHVIGRKKTLYSMRTWDEICSDSRNRLSRIILMTVAVHAKIWMLLGAFLYIDFCYC